MTSLNLNNRNDDLIELNKDSFSQSPFNFNIPSKKNRVSSNSFTNDDTLFNRNKVSSDVLSMSSRSSSVCSSEGRKTYMKKMHKSKNHKAHSDTSSDSSSVNSDKKSEVSESESGTNNSNDMTDESENSNEDTNSSGNSSIVKKKSYDPEKRRNNEINEKKEILYQLDRLESKGYKLPFKFNMGSDLEEMKMEYNRITREKELDASVRFQQKMMMAFVSGAEYMNTRYDPFTIKLDGWSEQVNENINDFDDIFEELHYKYKSAGKKMAPELRLMISLSGSAFMFHLTSRMFKEQPLPNIEEVLKSDPNLMKQFQNAAAKQFIVGNGNGNGNSLNNKPSRDNGNGLFNMVSNLFGSLNSPSMPSMSSSYQMKPKSVNDIDNIIQNVHSNISVDNSDHNNIETMSVSDEEITSIIEDTADIKILRNTKGNKNKRTLNI